MTTNIAIWLGITLLLSVTMNIFAFWYIAKIVSKFTFISENLNDLVTVVNNYKQHLKQVYKMEMFYGDETLEYLMSHTKSLLTILEDYSDIYTISIPIEPSEAGDSNFDRSDDTPETEEEETEEEVIGNLNEENVFYAGARRGNS